VPDEYSDYIVYVDESGDHSLSSIDDEYPVFILVFCIFLKEDYFKLISPAIQELKFRYFGHDMVILHEHDIKKAKGSFKFLIDKERRESFYRDIAAIIEQSSFTVIACCIRKNELIRQYCYPNNPYEVAMKFGLERVYKFMKKKRQSEKLLHIIAESRGNKENGEFTSSFQRVCNQDNFDEINLPFELKIADKKCNSCGLQIADLIARPIGRYVVNPAQSNQAYEVIKNKLDRDHFGKTDGFGLKIFP